MSIINFCSPDIPDQGELDGILKTSFQRGHLSNFGPLYDKAVSELSNLLNIVGSDKELVLTSSGHTALMAAYACLGTKKALVPAYTFESTRSAATIQGIELVISDVDVDTGCLSVDILNDMAKDYDTVVVVCALSTIPDLSGIEDFCRINNKRLIIDGAPTFGTSLYSGDRPIHDYGDAFCYSFHATKTLSVGECGAIIARTNIADKVRQFINFGFDRNKNVSMTGMNAKISEYTCAVLLALLKNIKNVIDRRKLNYLIYKQRLGKYIPSSTSAVTVYQCLPLFIEGKSKEVIEALNKKDIQALKYYKPLMNQPTARMLYDSNVCLPNHHRLTDSDVNLICDIVLETLGA